VLKTLGIESDDKVIDILDSESKESFLLHDKFQPYSIWEVNIIVNQKKWNYPENFSDDGISNNNTY
jgi:polyribonucleotide nucleotidyltransferase